MLITRTPFRVSFLGGGTDLPWFYREYGGAFLSTAIDKYVYLHAHPMFDAEKTLIKYSQTELVSDPGQVKHPIIREGLIRFGVKGIDFGVSSDIPAGTGLGSSSSFTVGLVHLLSTYSNITLNKEDLAAEACNIELNKLQEPIGIQDQFAASFGGLGFYQIDTSGVVTHRPINLDYDSLKWLDNSMLLVRISSSTRSASDVLYEQKKFVEANTSAIDSLIELKSLAIRASETVPRDITVIGKHLKEAWDLKKQSNPNATSPAIDDIVNLGLNNGALGAKVLGAGGGGFVLFVCNPDARTRVANIFPGSKTISPKIDLIGSHVIYNN